MNEVGGGSELRQMERQHSRWTTGAVTNRAYRNVMGKST